MLKTPLKVKNTPYCHYAMIKQTDNGILHMFQAVLMSSHQKMIGQFGFCRDLPKDPLLFDYEKIQHSIGTKVIVHSFAAFLVFVIIFLYHLALESCTPNPSLSQSYINNNYH